ncbi:MAG: hypothetical protein D3906_17385 [Candidatus Electrothrix sp. AUS1_2]|nr:hypothetical protein [Candidatus Electrothrix sp. AUS1_2]
MIPGNFREFGNSRMLYTPVLSQSQVGRPPVYHFPQPPKTTGLAFACPVSLEAFWDKIFLLNSTNTRAENT